MSLVVVAPIIYPTLLPIHTTNKILSRSMASKCFYVRTTFPKHRHVLLPKCSSQVERLQDPGRTTGKLVSSWSSSVATVPGDYVFPLDKRPGEVIVPVSSSIPVIDLGELGNHQDAAIQEILHASQEFGFFQVINHGVPETLLDDTMGVFSELFHMPDEDKASLYSEDHSKSCRLYTSSYYYADEEVHLWRDNLKHPCYPLDECIQLWPEKPTRYRDVVGTYSVEVRNLALRILELISKGLELRPGYFGDELTEVQLLSVNHYPTCPDPSLTLGLPKHCDPNLITIVFQGDVYGLQVYKDGRWIGVEPIPNAFVVNIGYQLQIISNGKFRAAEHRAVTNTKDPRTSIVTCFNPRFSSIIEPAKSLINICNPARYRAYQFNEFFSNYRVKKGDPGTALQDFEIQA